LGLFAFCLVESFRGLVRRPISILLAVGSIALSLVLAGTIWIASAQVTRRAGSWATGAVVAVYVQPNVTNAGRQRIREALQRIPGAVAVRHVSHLDALRRLKKNLQADAALLVGVKAQWVPESFEVRLHGARSDMIEAQQRLTTLGQTLDGIEEVRTVQEWHKKMDRLAGVLTYVARVVVVLTLLVCGYVVAVTVRLGHIAARQDAEILRVLGAPGWTTTAPVLFEALWSSLAGGLLGLAGLYGLHVMMTPRLAELAGPWLKVGFSSLVPWSTVAIAIGTTVLAALVGGRLTLIRIGRT